MSADSIEDDAVVEHRAYPKSVQPGIPMLGGLPDGWRRLPMGDMLQPVVRPVVMRDETEYQLVTARRSRGGIVPREQSLGKNIATKVQFQTRAGDFLISRRQISHGACGIVPMELDGALVSGEYDTLLPTGLLDPGFLRHLPHSIYFQQTCFHSSIGVHVEKLIFRLNEWLKWRFDAPPLLEQRRIAAVLDTWDDAIVDAERLCGQLEAMEQGRLFMLSRTWSRRPLGDFGRLRGGGTPSKARADYWSGGTIPWVSSKDMAQFHLITTDDYITEAALAGSTTTLIPQGSVLVVVRSGILRHTVPVAVNERPMAINQDIKALVVNGGVSGWLVGRLLALSQSQLRDAAVKTGTTVESIDVDALRSFKVPYPPDEDEAAAKGLFETMTTERHLVAQQLTLLRRQKRGLMQKLLAGEWRVSAAGDAFLPGGPAAAGLTEASA